MILQIKIVTESIFVGISGRNTTMTKRHKDIITRNRNFLIQNADIEHSLVLDYLMQEGTFAKYDVDCIQSVQGSQARSSAFLDRLLKKPDKAYEDFIENLRRSNQEHLVYRLERTDSEFSLFRCSVIVHLYFFLTTRLYPVSSYGSKG